MGASAFRPFQRVEATFHPRRTDDLRPGADAWIGWRGHWQALWVIEVGPYAGEWAMAMDEEGVELPPFAWVPSGDLRIHAVREG
jgi:hypothetical protein